MLGYLSQITLIFVFPGIVVILLVSNILLPDIVALILLLSLGLTGILTLQEAFSGFSRSAVAIMFSAYILAEGLRCTGITEHMSVFIVKLFGKGERRLIFGMMAAAAALSLFMNNIAAASLLLPARLPFYMPGSFLLALVRSGLASVISWIARIGVT